MNPYIKGILESKKKLIKGLPVQLPDPVEEGGCGVIGFTSNIGIKGKNIFEASIQMHNRGNGKGGGIAAAGLVPEQMGVEADILKNDYILQIALLDPKAEKKVENTYIAPYLKVDCKKKIKHLADYKKTGLEVMPPDIIQYFVRVKENVLSQFAKKNCLFKASARMVEDEYIYQNSFKLNQQFYASLGEKQAFVMSHARDLVIFKIVGYTEQVIQYYHLEEMYAHVWLAHQRYPTKGRVWHPAGAHPFIGLNEALIHNGDFANYYSISEYLRQHNIIPQFLTDTEVSVLIFDMLHRIYGYPLEYIIEALAPTTELDFKCLPKEKKKIYRAIQAIHMHGSPDGPWFFIIAQSDPDNQKYQLVGITDTAMLRPQVFALQEGAVSIGLIGSEKQAIDATLQSLSREDSRFRPIADKYWNARGGSHTDGGSFSFTVIKKNNKTVFTCTDKFNNKITSPPGDWITDNKPDLKFSGKNREYKDKILQAIKNNNVSGFYRYIISLMPEWNFNNIQLVINEIKKASKKNSIGFKWSMEILMLLNNRRYNCGNMKRSVVLQLIREGIRSILDSVPSIADKTAGYSKQINWKDRKKLRAPTKGEKALIVNSYDFPMEGDNCGARLVVDAFHLGWKKFIVYGMKGQRFMGCGLGPNTSGVRIDVFDSSGDYLASGIDGMEIHVHNNAQDQLGQIMKAGKLVVYGDVGQTFMYGAKGGEVYIMGNAAGRPLINAVGRPKVVINGTCLDFLAESFMAGDPHNKGGFVILNGITFDNKGKVYQLDTPYPGANLFSLASGGAIFVRDPNNILVDDQLNGGKFTEFTDKDWNLILPYLEANEKYFGISINNDLLTVNGVRKSPGKIYRKVQPVKLAALAKRKELLSN